MGQHEVEMAKTEAVFREVNERINETAQRFDSDDATFVCECADPDCAARVDASLTEYESVRAESTHFLLCDGHEVPSIERIVRRRPGYAVVEKFHAAVGRIVRQTDPRRPRRPGIEPA
jgi:hypothetical protein